jgi:hypothetical protein
MTVDLSLISLRQLEDEYFNVSEFVPKAEELVLKSEGNIRGPTYSNLRRLLRHHRERAIRDSETWYRDGFDFLLALYGAIEIGIWTGDLPAKLPEEFARRAFRVLTHPAVRRYYERHYRVLLPSLLRRRLQGNALVEAGSQKDPGRFALFLEISRPIEHDDDLETFLWFLDGGWRSADIDDTRWVLSNPGRFLRTMALKRPRTPLNKSVVGFTKFLIFCRNFERFLDQIGDQPILQAGCWHYHAYWFDRSADHLRDELDRAIECFASWEHSHGPDSKHSSRKLSGDDTADWLQANREAAEDRDRMRATVARLTSPEFGRALTMLIRT